MALLSLLYKVPPTKIGSLELDAAIRIAPRMNVEATQHPVERGADVTDHLRPLPDEVTIEGIVSNTPINRTQQTRAVEFVGGDFRTEFQTSASGEQAFAVPGYAEEALAKLRDIRAKGELITIVTARHVWENMALIELEAPEDATTGDALRFTATFREIVLVDNKVTPIKVAKDPRANKKAKIGKKAAQDLKNKVNTVRKMVSPWSDAISKGLDNINIFGFGT